MGGRSIPSEIKRKEDHHARERRQLLILDRFYHDQGPAVVAAAEIWEEPKDGGAPSGLGAPG